MATTESIGVMGAGTVGCWIGGQLLASGREVRFVGRERHGHELRQHGLLLSGLPSGEIRIAPEQIPWSTSATALAETRTVLVTVKAHATESVARELAEILPLEATVISLQNGVRNGALLRRHLAPRRVLEGVVYCSLSRRGEGHIHRGTPGGITFASRTPEDLIVALLSSGLVVQRRSDIEALLWGKLLLNLNNGLNAVSGAPLREELADRRFRLLLSAAIREGAAVLHAAGLRPRFAGPLRPSLLIFVLRLPDRLYHRLAQRRRTISDETRSSMWDDLRCGRRTEVDLLNGEIVRFGEARGVPTPVNRAIVDAVHRLQAGEAFSPSELFRLLD